MLCVGSIENLKMETFCFSIGFQGWNFNACYLKKHGCRYFPRNNILLLLQIVSAIYCCKSFYISWLVWTTWTLMSAVRNWLLNVITDSLCTYQHRYMVKFVIIFRWKWSIISVEFELRLQFFREMEPYTGLAIPETLYMNHVFFLCFHGYSLLAEGGGV